MTEQEQLKNEIKRKLSGYRALSAEHAQLSEKLHLLEAVLGSPSSPNMDGMPRASGVGRPVERRSLRHLELEQRYRKQLEKWFEARNDVEEMIKNLPPTERMVIRLRYSDGLRWEEVCDLVHYSWTHTHRIHNRALAKLAAAETAKQKGGRK